MTLRDRMVYAGIQTSRRVAGLSWFQRDVFRGLLHVADDFGRFENDAEMLRAVLYAPCLPKVSAADIGKAIVRMHEAGLVKLYTVAGRGYGKVLNFRQTLTKRRALYPEEADPPPEPELFATEVAPRVQTERRKETPHSPPPEAGGGEASPALFKPARFRRSVRLETLHEERERLENEMRDILRPGGCAYNVTPTGDKAKRFEELKAAHSALLERIEKRRGEIAREDAA